MKNFILFLKNLLIHYGLYKIEYKFSPKINFGSKKANNFFKKKIKKSNLIFEYGAGNSTHFMEKNKLNYISIESKKNIFNDLRKNKLNVSLFSLGITKRYSIPYFIKLNKKKIIRYANSIYYFKKIKPDLILIDGRFRVMCFFSVMFFLKKKKFHKTNVIIDDFNRKEYSIINHYFKVIKVGRIGVAKISNQKKKFNLKKIETKYLLDPS